MQIIKAELDDVTLIAPLFDEYRQFYDMPSDLGKAQAYLSERIANHETHLLFAAQEGEVMGFVHLFPSFSSVYVAQTLILNDLYVAPAYRRSGTGRALMLAAANYSRDQGYRSLRLETQEENVAARRLYQSLGYQQERGFVHYVLNTPGGS